MKLGPPPRAPRRLEPAAAMRPAAFVLVLASAFLAAARASEPPVTRVGAVEYVGIDDAADRLGLKVVHLAAPPSVILKDGARPVARIADHSREIDLVGLRVFLGDPVVSRGDALYVSRTDFQDHLLPRLRPDLCGAPPRQPRVIAIDPGHGGTDQGATNKALGTMEKTYTLDVALRLKRMLEGAGYQVVLTRDSDYDLPKPLRSEIANRAKADLFVSVHFNSLYPNTRTTGVEVLYFPPRLQRSAESWSPGRKDDAENGDAPVNAFDAWNSVLAGLMHRRLLDALHDGDRGEKFEHLGVLRGLRCPGVLVEPAFISSDAEGAKLATKEFRETIAAAVFEGIRDYAELAGRLHPAEKAAAEAGPAPHSQPTRPAGP
jgi:N-acetylmuramoyl-L-alanine amidase